MNNQITKLQKIMLSKKIDALVIPSHDEFQSEFVSPQNARLKYITNFSGSNGIAVITTGKNHFFFTDGRYLAQAKKELESNFEILDLSTEPVIPWLKKFSEKQIVGFNHKLHSINFIETLGKNIKILKKNLVDLIWKERPLPSKSSIFKYDLKYAGISITAKMKNFRISMKEENIDTFILNTPESICWLLNIRGNDSLYSPIVFSYLIITTTETIIFSDANIDKDAKKYFDKNKIKHLKLDKLEKFLNSINDNNIATTKRAPFWIKEKIPEIKITQDPSELPRACKNKIEISNAIEAHKRDSIAVTNCLKWIKDSIKTNTLSEILISEKLLELRSKQKNFISPSFKSIVGFKEHGAIIHYSPTPKSNKKIKENGLLLIDSGGQYLEGTTDITRTISIGNPSREKVNDFTLVLKGHIHLITSIFPEGTTGSQLDTLARSHLWKEGKNYAHGTGHGVGSFLSVHEGPHSISRSNTVPLKEGMIVSIEPGFYKTKKYGIRIENLAYIKKSTKFKDYLEFETLTKVPIEENLVDFSLLTKEEERWLKQYNKECNKLMIE